MVSGMDKDAQRGSGQVQPPRLSLEEEQRLAFEADRKHRRPTAVRRWPDFLIRN